MYAKRSDGTKLVLLHEQSGWFEWSVYVDRIELGPETGGSPVTNVQLIGVVRTGVRGRDWQAAVRNAQAAWNLW